MPQDHAGAANDMAHVSTNECYFPTFRKSSFKVSHLSLHTALEAHGLAAHRPRVCDKPQRAAIRLMAMAIGDF